MEGLRRRSAYFARDSIDFVPLAFAVGLNFESNKFHARWRLLERERSEVVVVDNLLSAEADNLIDHPMLTFVEDSINSALPGLGRDFDAVFSANVVHFVSWPEVERLFVGVARCLNAGGLLMLYGPYNYDGQFTSEGNIALDGWLRERNPESGIKDFEQVLLLARKHHLHLRADEEMPSNNRTLVFQKADTE